MTHGWDKPHCNETASVKATVDTGNSAIKVLQYRPKFEPGADSRWINSRLEALERSRAQRYNKLLA